MRKLALHAAGSLTALAASVKVADDKGETVSLRPSERAVPPAAKSATETILAALEAQPIPPLGAGLPETRLIAKGDVPGTSAERAATLVADRGGSPRAQIDAARAVSGRALGYVSHCGKRQRERALKRLAAADVKGGGIK